MSEIENTKALEVQPTHELTLQEKKRAVQLVRIRNRLGDSLHRLNYDWLSTEENSKSPRG